MIANVRIRHPASATPILWLTTLAALALYAFQAGAATVTKSMEVTATVVATCVNIAGTTKLAACGNAAPYSVTLTPALLPDPTRAISMAPGSGQQTIIETITY